MNDSMNFTHPTFISPVQRSLMEQLKISDHEIMSRKALLGFTDEDVELLVELQPVIADRIGSVVDTFYERQLQSREIAQVIGDSETLQRLREAMRRYIIDLFDGVYDADYVNRRLRIGKVHHRIGVSPKLYVSALAILLEILHEVIHPDVVDKASVLKNFKQRSAIRRLFLFDMQLVFETYTSTLVSEVETMRQELEEYVERLEQTIAERTEQLRDLTIRDSLTGLLNQRGFYEYMRRELASAERHNTMLALVYFDLDNFKMLNDVKGHKAGDALLIHVGRSVLGSIREVDLGFRYGGDEFCIVLPQADEKAAREVFARVQKAFEMGLHHGVTMSAGFADTGPDNYLHIDALLRLADTRMYEAKTANKEGRRDNGRVKSAGIPPTHHPAAPPTTPVADLDDQASASQAPAAPANNAAGPANNAAAPADTPAAPCQPEPTAPPATATSAQN